jgi:hypothetical protein
MKTVIITKGLKGWKRNKIHVIIKKQGTLKCAGVDET